MTVEYVNPEYYSQPHAVNPRASVYPTGTIALNSATVRAYKLKGYPYIRIGFDKKTEEIVLEFGKKKTIDCRPVAHHPTNQTLTISAVRIFEHFEIPRPYRTQKYPVKVVQNKTKQQIIISFTLKETQDGN